MNYYDKTLADFPIPESVAIERQVLRDAIGCPETIGELMAMLSTEMFTSDERRHIWEMIVWMHRSHLKIDLLSVQSRVGKHFIPEVLSSGADLGSTATATFEHAKLLRDAYSRRKAYFAGISLLEASARSENTEIDIFSETDKAAKGVQEGTIPNEGSRLCDVVNRVADEIQDRENKESEGKRWRIPTGFPLLDGLTYNGWGPGQLIVLAARPSVGKTAISLQMAKASAEAGFPTLFFSLEMTEMELGRRLLSSTGIVSQNDMMIGQMDWVRYEAAAGKITSLPIIIDDKSRFLSDITARITIAAERGKCKIAFIDYLGFIKDKDGARLSMYQQISNITAELKATAKRAGIPVVLLCQLNRDSVKDGRPPQLYDLRDSGSIEQDADVVLMLEQVKNSLDEDATPDVNMWLRKNRQYKKEVCITIRPDDSYSRFDEIGMR